MNNVPREHQTDECTYVTILAAPRTNNYCAATKKLGAGKQLLIARLKQFGNAE